MSGSSDGLVGYDDWFTPSRSCVRFTLGVTFSKIEVTFSFLLIVMYLSSEIIAVCCTRVHV